MTSRRDAANDHNTPRHDWLEWSPLRRPAIGDAALGLVGGGLRLAVLLGLLCLLIALAGCASAPTAVEGLAATARLHATTMEAAGYAAEAGALAPEQLAEVRDAGRRVELLLRAAQAALEIHLITSGGATGEGLDARLAELQAAVMELVRVAVAAGLEVGR